jgi:cytochrome c peroxidase
MSGMASVRFIDTGSTNQPWAIAAPDLPLFRVTCNPDAPPHPFLGRMILTQDPGRALITGKCADVGAIMVQQLRGLSARAPYFSNGSARTLAEVVEFYDRRFSAHFTDQEKEDLVNFLSVL